MLWLYGFCLLLASEEVGTEQTDGNFLNGRHFDLVLCFDTAKNIPIPRYHIIFYIGVSYGTIHIIHTT